MSNMETFHHFSHQHGLKPMKFDKGVSNSNSACQFCGEKFLSSEEKIYGCEKELECNYLVHRVCTELSQQLKHHPFHQHPQHVLHFFAGSLINEYCSICQADIRINMYKCNQCAFTLDVKCAVLTLYKCEEPMGHNIGHEHPLLVCERPQNIKYPCICCGQPFEAAQDIYVCLECNCMMHESCAKLPIEIRHPLHPEHSLRFLAGDSFRRCSLCFERMHSWYHCSKCSFYLDLDCAKLVPVRKGHDQAGYLQIQPETHPHPLIQCDITRNFRNKCSACGQHFEDSVYVCLQCPTSLLHKTCANLPREIIHSFHPQHILTLIDNSGNFPRVEDALVCTACRGATAGNLRYFCKERDFSLDIRCATMKLPMIRSDMHRHDLTYFNFKIPRPYSVEDLLQKGAILRVFNELTAKSSPISCNNCGKECTENFLRCIECDFNVHAFCYPSLPPIAKHDRHRHPLTFTNSQIKDDPDEDEYDEFYCNACEERRELTHPSYYCAESECHFVAHVHCVLPEILPYLHSKSLEDSSSKVENVKLETSMTPVSTDHKEIEGGCDDSAADTEARDENVDSLPHGSAATNENAILQILYLYVVSTELEKQCDALKTLARQSEVEAYELAAKRVEEIRRHSQLVATLNKKLKERENHKKLFRS